MVEGFPFEVEGFPFEVEGFPFEVPFFTKKNHSRFSEMCPTFHSLR